MEHNTNRDYSPQGSNPQYQKKLEAHPSADDPRDQTGTPDTNSYVPANHELDNQDSSVASGTNPDRYNPVNSHVPEGPEAGAASQYDRADDSDA